MVRRPFAEGRASVRRRSGSNRRKKEAGCEGRVWSWPFACFRLKAGKNSPLRAVMAPVGPRPIGRVRAIMAQQPDKGAQGRTEQRISRKAIDPLNQKGFLKVLDH